MMLTELDLPPVITTSTGNPVADFYTPALRASVNYDRGVGYFSSGWLRKTAEGMAAFATNGGRARLITSPILDEDDWEALRTGEEARYDRVLRDALERNINELQKALDEQTLSALAWMVADGILSFKLALPQMKLEGGDFHDKFGIFTDEAGNQVAFMGSPNETIRGTVNSESISIFSSWKGEALRPYIDHISSYFETLWLNQNTSVRVFELPEAAREQILRLRSRERPYPEPPWGKLVTTRERGVGYKSRPSLPSDIVLREYQREAVDAWFENNVRGIIEMATGTGKTITSLAAATRLFDHTKKLLVVIACPFVHLVTQWADEVAEFGYRFLIVPGSQRNWRDELANELLDFAGGYIKHLVVLTTHATFSNPDFWNILEERTLPTLLIADEMHGLGAPQRQSGLRESYQYRLGLSATPRRWFDEEGTDQLFDYFGGTIFEFTLADGIPEFLTPYDYYPFFVELDGQELERYQELTEKVRRRAFISDEDENDELLELYLIQRQQIVVNAQAKYDCFSGIVADLDPRTHTLVYCSPEQIDRVQSILNAKALRQHRFTFEETTEERTKLLDSFASGKHDILVAMRCLDEGVDVPATRNAIFLASSGNPRQFIQRRGRILRKSEGKQKASIYDIIVVPTLTGNLDPFTFDMERRILRKELQRYNEFASLALNSTHALNKIAPIKRRYLLLEDAI